MTKPFAIAVLLSSVALCGCVTATPDMATQEMTAPEGTARLSVPPLVEIQLLGLNDFHGNIETPTAPTSYRDGEETVREVLGGAARLGATLDSLREGQEYSLTVAAGDLIGGSPFVSANFLDEPAIMALSMAGLDVASVGNHEFDRGIGELLRVQNGGCEQFTSRQPCALEPFPGAAFEYLAGNVVDAKGRSLLPGTSLRDLGPVTVGFIGLTLRDTARLVAPSMTQGLAFLDEAATANRLARDLVAQGADIVVLLLHEGGRVDPTQNISGCPNLSGRVVPILSRLDPAISVVVSGHSHQSYTCHVPGDDGDLRLLTSAGRNAAFVTDIRLSFDPAAGHLVSSRAVNVPVRGDPQARPDIAAMVHRYAAAAAPLAARVVGSLLPATGEGEDCLETPMANLVADAQLAAARQAPGDEADVAFINTSGLRTSLVAGEITYGEIFAMQPFGNVLEVLEMSGEDLRAALEEQFCSSDPARPCFTLLAPSANLTYAFDRSRPAGQRIVEIMLNDRPLAGEETYRVVFNNFLASGGDGLAGLDRHPTVREAGNDLDALEGWLARGVAMPVCGRLRDVTPR